MIFQYGLEPVLIQQILISFEAILEISTINLLLINIVISLCKQNHTYWVREAKFMS